METVTKGAIIGGIWGILSILPYSTIKDNDSPTKRAILTLLGLPTYIAVKSGAQFQYVFVGSPLVGATIGAGTGYIYEKRKY